MPILFWLDITAYGIATLLALTLALMVVGVGPQHARNRLFALWALTAATWTGGASLLRLSLWLQRGDPALFGELSTLAFLLLGPLLLSFTVRHVELPTRHADLLAFLGIVGVAVLAIPLFDHRLVFDHYLGANGTTHHTLSSLGAVLAVLPALYFLGSLVLFWRKRHQTDEPYLALSVLCLVIGLVVGGVLDIAFPILSIATLLGVAILGYGVVSRQLFNPLRERTDELQREIVERKRAEEALRKSEERFRQLSRAAFEAITISRQGKIIDVNEQFERLFGYSRSQAIGMAILDLVAPESLEFVKAKMEAKHNGPYEHLARRQDGTTLLIEVYGRILPWGGDQARVTAIRDITERKQTEKALQESKERYRSLFDGVPVGLYRTTSTGQILDANQTLIQMLGAPDREHLLQTNAVDFYPDPEVRKEWQALMDRQGIVRDFETRFRRHDGQIIWVRNNSRVVHDPRGGVLYYEGSLQDITERKRAEEELATIQALLTAAIEQTPAGVIVADAPDVRIRLANSAALGIRGETRDALTDIPVDLHPSHWQTFHPDGTPCAPEELPLSRAILHGETSSDVEVIIRRETGEDRWVLANAAPVRDAEGKIVAGVVIFPDITERKHLEEQFRQAQKMEALGRLAGGVAHDFNNLLTIIRMAIGILQFKLHSSDPLWQEIKEIRDASERATTLTKQLLRFSRQEKIEPQRLNLNHVLHDVGNMLQRIIGEDVELTTRFGSDLWAVSMDPAQVDQVLMNLAINARDAMPQGGQLTIETANVVLSEDYATHQVDAKPGDHVMLSIIDTGQGMDDAVKAHIFEPFFTTKEEGKGTGLGLATVYGIVRQSGGHIACKSQVGRGSTFRIYLPRAQEQETGADDDVQMPSAVRSGPAVETILVVEDETTIRDLVVQILAANGYQILAAEEGTEALQISARHDGPIHLLVTDVVMPHMSGRELADRLRSQRPEIRILYISGYTDEITARHGLGQDRVAFLPKPFNMVDLLQKIADILNEEE